MTSVWRYQKFGFWLIALLLIAGYCGASEDLPDTFNEKTQKTITKGVLDNQITIVPQLNKLNFGLGRYDGINFYFIKSLSKIFFQDRSIEVRVTAVEFDDLKVSLNLFHPALGDGSLRFVFDHDLIARITDEDLQKILLTSIGDENNLYVFADPESKIFHLYTCLHTKDESKLIRMTLEEARRQSFRECAFCFKKVLYLPDIAVEMEIEREWSELLRDYEPLKDGSARQSKMSNLGQRILRNWPIPLLGYDYAFHLIESKTMNAIAIPTGKIVVSTALLEALENEEELEALLLLAIAHIEMRHSLRQHQLKLQDSKNSDAMKNLVKAAGSVAGMFPGGSLIGTLGSLPFKVSAGRHTSISGFDEDFDKEADALAALYFDLYHESRDNLRTLIQKMQLAQLTEHLHPELGDGKKEFHFNDRIKRLEDTKFLYFSDQNSFVFKKKNRLPVQMDLIYQSINKNESKLILFINDRSLLPDFSKANGSGTISILVQDKNGTQEFKLLEKFTTKDLWGARLTFEASGENKQRFIRDTERVSLELTIPGKIGDRREEQIKEQLKFVKGKLAY
jgi:hypothetical protein